MQKDIDTLIDYYRWEVVRVEGLMEENLKNHCYREMDFDVTALRYLRQELEILLSLKDPHYHDKKRLKERIRRVEEITQRDSSVPLGLTYQIEAWKRELKELSAIKHRENHLETQRVDENLYLLAANKISGFRIYLDSRRRVFLELRLMKGNTHFHISFYCDNNDYSWYLNHSVITDLRLSENGQKGLEMVVPIENQKNLLNVKELLSRLVIGLKVNLEKRNRAYLEILK